jgi:hypothetical protein
MESFVYKWTNIETGKFYIGKHKGTIDDGYISSGQTFLDVYWKNPNIFKREILFNGSESECLRKEGELIKQAINTVGYRGIYNQTHWDIVKGWKRTCLHCGAWCDPANEEWAQAFELNHFNNCSNKPVDWIKPKKISTKEWRENRKSLGLIKESTPKVIISNKKPIIIDTVIQLEKDISQLQKYLYTQTVDKIWFEKHKELKLKRSKLKTLKM